MTKDNRDALIDRALLNGMMLGRIEFMSENGLGIFTNDPDGRKWAIEAMRAAEWITVPVALSNEYARGVVWPIRLRNEQLQDVFSNWWDEHDGTS